LQAFEKNNYFYFFLKRKRTPSIHPVSGFLENFKKPTSGFPEGIHKELHILH
jgi:hypothetical protein